MFFTSQSYGIVYSTIILPFLICIQHTLHIKVETVILINHLTVKLAATTLFQDNVHI